MKAKRISILVIATSNTHKLEEINYILDGVTEEILSLKNFPEIGLIRETGSSFEENALLKARTVYRYTGLFTLADDSGLEVDALNGAPGIFSARFAGREHDYGANNRKLLQELKNVPAEKRGAQFRCVVAIVGKNIEQVVQGIVPGHIIREVRGSGGFGYDPLFIPEGFDCTYAELTEAVKNRISHRAIAFTKAKEILLELIKTRNIN
jgi:XTP/dITP diphosphohydrolase